MHPSMTETNLEQHPPEPDQPPQTLVDLITNVLTFLLLSTLTVRSFIGRWQIIRTKLTSLQSSLSSLSTSSHWTQNPLLHTLLPSVLSTLQRLHSLSQQSSLSTLPNGKLYFQSDLDMASASLSYHLNDLNLLLRSGVLNQSNAIVLSRPGPDSKRDELVFFIRDLFTRLQIGGVEFKKKALESLLQLLDEDEKSKSASLVAKEGNIGYLISLLDMNQQNLICEQAVLAVSMLVSLSDEARKIVFEEGGLGPLLRVLESGSVHLKEKAALAIEAITECTDNAWAVAAYGGVTVLIEACRSGSQAMQNYAVGAISNVAGVDDIKMALVEEGAISVLLHLLISGSITAQEKAANCVVVLASSSKYFRSLIIQEKGLHRLMHLIEVSTDTIVIEHVLHALTSLSISDSTASVLSSSTSLVLHLGEFIKHGNMALQQLAVSLLASLSISGGNRRAVASCMGSLVKLMECTKPVGLQESATVALVSLLTVRSNRKEFARDEKSLMKLVQMLDPTNELVAKKFPVMVVGTLLSGGITGCRKRLLAAGAYHHLPGLAEMEVAGARKVLQRLAGNRIKSMFSRTWRE